jgi:hypothetical protein
MEDFSHTPCPFVCLEITCVNRVCNLLSELEEIPETGNPVMLHEVRPYWRSDSQHAWWVLLLGERREEGGERRESCLETRDLLVCGEKTWPLRVDLVLSWTSPSSASH